MGLPVQPVQPPPLQGITSALTNPQFSTALGLMKYAQIAQLERPVLRSGRVSKACLAGGKLTLNSASMPLAKAAKVAKDDS